MKNEKRKMSNGKSSPMIRPDSRLNLLSFIIHFSLFIFLAGCRGHQKSDLENAIPPDLSDTISAGQSREVVLTDLTGGFYFDDAFRQPDFGEYGYSRWGEKFIAGWEIAGLDGKRLDADPIECVVGIGSVTRKYQSGLREDVAVPPEIPGMLLAVTGSPAELVVRPIFDFRPLETEDAPEYLISSVKREGLAVARSDTVGGWIGIASEGCRFVPGASRTRMVHSRGEAKGRVAVSEGFIPGELVAKHRATIAFGWSTSPEGAIAVAGEVLSSRKVWQAKRLQWGMKILGGTSLVCDNRPFTHAFALARLSLAGMMVTCPIGGPDSLQVHSLPPPQTHPYLMKGIPYAPYPDGWFTMLSLPGIAAMEGVPDESVRLIAPILERQNADSNSVKCGMLPTRIGPDGDEYRVNLISGLTAMAYDQVRSRLAIRDSIFEDTLALALVRDLLGTARHRLFHGAVNVDSAEHFLWDSPAAPKRPGALIENGVLLGKVRHFLESYRRLEMLVPGLPHALITDRSRGASIFSYNPRDTSRFMRRAVASIMMDRYMAGQMEAFLMPLSTEEMMSQFAMARRAPTDRITYRDSTISLVIVNADPTHRVAGLLAEHWNSPRDRSQDERILNWAKDLDMLTAVGLRSLSPLEEGYQAEHFYQADEAPEGSTGWGDALIWTAGDLGDMYATIGDWGSLLALADTLSDRINTTGVLGGLSEAENSESEGGENAAGSPMFAASLAGYVRLVSDYIIGVAPQQGQILHLKPRVPDGWGKYRIETRFLNGKVWLEKESRFKYRVGQEGIKPNVLVALDVIPATDEQAQTSIRMVPGDELEVTFIPIGEGHWQAEVKGW